LIYRPELQNPVPMAEVRVEKDFLGEVKVPKDALWGVQTQRAIDNFRSAGFRFGRRFLYSLGLIKKACAETNLELGLLDPKLAKAIVQAAEEVMAGTLDAHFRSTSSRPGAGLHEHERERGDREPGERDPREPLGTKGPVHPNDHVNMGQSSNDVIRPRSIVAALLAVRAGPPPALGARDVPWQEGERSSTRS